jgi:hypothetical protein
VADAGTPVLSLSVRDGARWRVAATSTALAQALSGEDGQRPWRQTFRWRHASARTEKDVATLTLVGSLGTLWNAEIVIQCRADTCALNGELRLTPRRQARCFEVQLPLLLALPESPSTGPYSGRAISVGEAAASLPDGARSAAAHRANFSVGLSWPGSAPLANWDATRVPAGDDVLAPLLGAAWSGGDRGEIVLPGATLVFPFRLFAFSPSDTVRDAMRFVIP